MLYTAAIMLCLKEVDHSYQSCQIVNAEFKYVSEEQCWNAINIKLQQLIKYPQIDYIYEAVDAKCIEWLPAPESKEKL